MVHQGTGADLSTLRTAATSVGVVDTMLEIALIIAGDANGKLFPPIV